MSQTFLDILSDAVAKYGASVIGLIFTGILGWIGRTFLKDHLATKFLVRVTAEAKDVVLEVAQTYREEIRAGRADGFLTQEERAKAFTMAMAKLKSNLGPKLLERATRVLGYDDAGLNDLLTTKVEAQVQRLNLIKSGALPPVSVDGSSAPPAAPPRLPLPPPPTSER